MVDGRSRFQICLSERGNWLVVAVPDLKHMKLSTRIAKMMNAVLIFIILRKDERPTLPTILYGKTLQFLHGQRLESLIGNRQLLFPRTHQPAHRRAAASIALSFDFPMEQIRITTAFLQSLLQRRCIGMICSKDRTAGSGRRVFIPPL